MSGLFQKLKRMLSPGAEEAALERQLRVQTKLMERRRKRRRVEGKKDSGQSTKKSRTKGSSEDGSGAQAHTPPPEDLSAASSDNPGSAGLPQTPPGGHPAESTGNPSAGQGRSQDQKITSAADLLKGSGTPGLPVAANSVNQDDAIKVIDQGNLNQGGAVSQTIFHKGTENLGFAKQQQNDRERAEINRQLLLRSIGTAQRLCVLDTALSVYDQLKEFLNSHRFPVKRESVPELSFISFKPPKEVSSGKTLHTLPEKKTVDTRLALFYYFDHFKSTEDLKDGSTDTGRAVNKYFEHLETLGCSEETLTRFLLACTNKDAIGHSTDKHKLLCAVSVMMLAFFEFVITEDEDVQWSYNLKGRFDENTYIVEKTERIMRSGEETFYTCKVSCNQFLKTEWDRVEEESFLSRFSRPILGRSKKPVALPPLAELIASCLVVGGTDKRYGYVTPRGVFSVLTGIQMTEDDVKKEWTLVFDNVSPKPSGGAAAPSRFNMMTRKP